MTEQAQFPPPEQSLFWMTGAVLLHALDRVAAGESSAEVYTALAEFCTGMREDI